MNANSLGAQTEEEAKKDNWFRMDCLAKYQLNSGHDNKKLMKWFESQDEEWQQSRISKFKMRINQRRW